MYSKKVNEAIELQILINNQISSKGIADIELVNDLNKLLESLNSYECELIMEWYNKQSKQNDEQYVQMEIDFLQEQEGQDAINQQWDM